MSRVGREPGVRASAAPDVVFDDCLVTRYVFPHIRQAPGCPAPLLEEVRFVYRRRRRLTES